MPKLSKKQPVVTRKQKLSDTHKNDGFGCSSASISKKVEHLENPIKSQLDNNEYRFIKLANGLKALLVDHRNLSTKKDSQAKSIPADKSDKTSSDSRNKDSIHKEDIDRVIAACTLTINVGSLNDSANVPCISYILREVIVGASKKYPRVNGFKEFLKRNGGTIMAIGDHEKTVFSFSVVERSFRDALDRFANFFTEPLLRQDMIDAWKNHMEKKNLSTVKFSNFEKAKTYLFSKIASGYDQHPACHLGPNQAQNLRDQSNERVYKEVEKFMRRHYSAHRMTVIIDGHAPLDTLEQYAKTYFSGILNNKLPPPDFTRFSYDRCFDIKEFQMMYHMMQPSISKNIQGDYQLEINWPMPSARKLYRCRPQDYIARTINHEGEGSLASYLKMKNWCLRIDCGVGRSNFENSVYSLFSICISLTQEGYKNRKQVLDVVYAYTNFLRREGPQHRIWESFRKVTIRDYRRDVVPLFAFFCATIYEHIDGCTPRDYLMAGFIYLEYDPVAIKECLDLLSPEKANVIVYDKDFSNRDSLGEEWEEEDNDPVHYRRTTIAKEWIEYWNTVEPLPEFKLPCVESKPDDDFEMISPPKNPSEYPEKIHADEVSEVYYKLDTKFRTATTHIHQWYCSSLPQASPENAVMMDVFGRIVNDLATDILESVVDASSYYQINDTDKGIWVKVTATKAKAAFFTAMIADIASNVWKHATKQLYDSMLENKMRDYELGASDPAALADEVKLSIVRTVRWTAVDKLTACSNLNYGNFKDFAKQYTDSVFLRCLVQGNMCKADVVANVKECIHELKCQPRIPNYTNDMEPPLIYKIPEGEHCYRFYIPRRSTISKNPVTITNYYQFPAKSFKQTVLIQLLNLFIRDPQFSIFRARQKLNDIAVSLGAEIFGKHGYSLSAKMTTFGGLVDAAVANTVLEKYRKALHFLFKNMSEKDWIKARKIFTNLKSTPPANLDDEVHRNWMEIGAQAYVFHRDVLELAALEGLTITELIRGMMHLTSGCLNIRKLTIQCVGEKEAAQNLAYDRTEKPNYQELLKTLCGTAKERAEKSSDYFITDINNFQTGLPTFRISGKITPRSNTK